MTTADARRWFAEDLRVTLNLKSPFVVEALATVPRERFLGPGPWTLYGETGPRATDDADPRHVYHNLPVAIDAARNLYNGQPGLIARWLEMLAIAPGERVLHVGCATGYFTALMAEIVGPAGRVHALDVDDGLARRAQENLQAWPWADAAAGDGRSHLPSDMDVVLVHAGATHPLAEWLDAVRDGGRLLVPLTSTIPGMPSGISKGMVLVARRTGTEWSATVQGLVMIYTAVGVRDEAAGAELGQAMMSGALGKVTRLRRDAHARAETCIVHGEACLSA